MGRREQVDLRGKLHRRMAPVSIGVNAQLTAAHERLELVLHFFEMLRRILVPRRQAFSQLRCLLRICLQRRDDVHPVKRGEMVEVDDMIVHTMCAVMIRFLIYWAFRGISRFSAFSTDLTEASAWTDVQTPQMRWVKSQTSRASRPFTIFSIPRHI